MNQPSKSYVALFAIVAIICLVAFTNKPALDTKQVLYSKKPTAESKIQVAIL